ncbi:unnamed protein product [Lactuca virosa]|uniref:Retrotransposon gag domain-containing protein n=1 Tax=Lactuca virosa TaxID=75947 RepID=A0AAU9P7D5_9ASTR|nr:unnamed protein product [Lactuca virosa]
MTISSCDVLTILFCNPQTHRHHFDNSSTSFFFISTNFFLRFRQSWFESPDDFSSKNLGIQFFSPRTANAILPPPNTLQQTPVLCCCEEFGIRFLSTTTAYVVLPPPNARQQPVVLCSSGEFRLSALHSPYVIFRHDMCHALHGQRRRRSRQIRGRLLHVITGSKVNKLQMDVEKKNDSGEVTQDMDQGHCESSTTLTLVKDLNKFLRDVRSMSKMHESLGTCVEYMEEELPKYLYKVHCSFEIREDDEPRSLKPESFLPTFSEDFDHDEFCYWIKDVESGFEYCDVAEDEEVEVVVRCTLPRDGEAFKWWQGIQELSKKVDEKHPIGWDEMKRLFMAKYLFPKTV